MEYRSCADCGDYAVIHAEEGPEGRLLCLECLDKREGRRSADAYICSVESCGNAPDFMVSIEDERWRTLLVCEQHFRRIRPGIRAYMDLPRWLTNGEDVAIDEDGVTIEMEFSSNG